MADLANRAPRIAEDIRRGYATKHKDFAIGIPGLPLGRDPTSDIIRKRHAEADAAEL